MSGRPPGAWVVAVDIGGTKTRAVLAPLREDAASAVRERVVPSSSWRGPLGDARADARGLSALLTAELGPDLAPFPLVVGAHGYDAAGQCEALERELRHSFSGPVRVLNDSELMAPAMGRTDAIGLVVGTGSIATGRDDAGELVAAGGWGWLLGDEGSAPGLVRDATRAVLAHLDGGGASEPLVARLMGAFDARDGVELSLAATAAASAETWGAHAPAVFAAAKDGSALAEAVIRDAGERLAALVERLLRRGVRADAVVAGGSVIERQPLLQDAVRSALARRHPDIALQILERPPVTGAVALARALAHDTPPTRTDRTPRT